MITYAASKPKSGRRLRYELDAAKSWKTHARLSVKRTDGIFIAHDKTRKVPNNPARRIFFVGMCIYIGWVAASIIDE